MIDAGTSQPTSKNQIADSFKTTSEHFEISYMGSIRVETAYDKVQSQINPVIDALIEAMIEK